MTLYLVSFEEGTVALDSSGTIRHASSERARAEVVSALRRPVRVWLTGDATMLYKPGDTGHVLAAIEHLPGAVVTSNG